MKVYDSYKDSGVNWLGNVPSHWELNKFKHLFREKEKETNRMDLPCGSISFGKVVFKNDNKIPKSTKASYQVLNKGNFLINPLNLNYDLKSLRVALSDRDVVVSSGYIVLKEIKNMNKEYFNYLLHVFDILFMKTLGAGVRQTLSFTHISDTILCFPPLNEQKAIANFLNEKSALIDKAINIKETEIERLKEYKQATIQKLVTQGFDPDVEMKDSGISWLGDIPKHWEVKKLKYLTEINKDSLPDNTNKNLQIDYVDIGSVSFENGIEKIEQYSFGKAPSRARRIANTGDSIISTVRTYLKAIDFITKEKSKNIYSTGFAILSPKNNVEPEFLSLSIKSDYFCDQVSYYSKGMSYPAINSTDLGNIFIVMPDIHDQKLITIFLNKVTLSVNSYIQLKLNEIEKLKEYKRSLINDAVTGKISVL